MMKQNPPPSAQEIAETEQKFQIGDQWYYRGNRSRLWLYLQDGHKSSSIAAQVPAECWPILEEVARLSAITAVVSQAKEEEVNFNPARKPLHCERCYKRDFETTEIISDHCTRCGFFPEALELKEPAKEEDKRPSDEDIMRDPVLAKQFVKSLSLELKEPQADNVTALIQKAREVFEERFGPMTTQTGYGRDIEIYRQTQAKLLTAWSAGVEWAAKTLLSEHSNAAGAAQVSESDDNFCPVCKVESGQHHRKGCSQIGGFA